MEWKTSVEEAIEAKVEEIARFQEEAQREEMLAVYHWEQEEQLRRRVRSEPNRHARRRGIRLGEVDGG